jgi:biotin carboxylase
MPLRSTPALTVPTIGPRSRAVAAPQAIGKRVGAPPRPGWDVSRIWPERLLFVIVFAVSRKTAPKAKNLPHDNCRTRGQLNAEYKAKMPENQAFAAGSLSVSALRASSTVIISAIGSTGDVRKPWRS